MKDNFDNITTQLRSFIDKIKADKKMLIIISAALIGVFLILFSGNEKKTDNNEEAYLTSESIDKAEIERSVTELVESIRGAGKAKIMITYECDGETVFAKDTEEKNDSNETDMKNQYIIIDGENGETGLKVKNIYPRVMGVAVICEGGEDPVVKERIYSMISALFDINTNSISVTVMA